MAQSPSGNHELLHEIACGFESLLLELENAIERLADDDSGSMDLSALARAKEAAQRAASLVRNGTSGLRRAFD